MRLLPRDTDFSSVATSLSLAVANYKPIPQLPTGNSSSLSASSGGSQLLPVGTSGGAQQSFQVQSSKEVQSYDNSHPVSSWGEPSVLYVPESEISEANQLKSTKTVGPGKCAVQKEYTPVGGWSALPSPTFAPFDPIKANIYRYRQQQGVNLGSWFVQEGWMESKFMSCGTGSKQAEMDILSGFGTSKAGIGNATSYMEKHWDTWITESDFAKMATIGINTVRIPIGYWSVGPYFTHESPFQDYADVYEYSWRYVARAINWAAKYEIGVLLDLHGAYGSQNGQAHSGLSTGKIEFFTKKNMNLTKDLLLWLAKEVSDVTNIVGIQLLNEPVDRDSLWSWYSSTMDAMRNVSTNAATVPLYFHDAFKLSKGANFVAGRKDFVVQDHHSYFVYTSSDQSMSADDHTSKIQGSLLQSFEKQSDVARRNVITGEWSCALSPSSLSKTKGRKEAQTDFCKAQVDAYRTAQAGWTFWSWQMENCGDNGGWCFQQAIKDYLWSSFDSWGLQAHTSSYYKELNATDAKKSSSLTDTINRIAISNNSSNSRVQMTEQADSKDNKSERDNDDLTEDDFNTDVPINIAGFVGMVQDKEDNSSVNDASRIGMVEKGKRGLGSVAAQAGAKARRAANNAQLASQYGYNDGFKSAVYFAGNSQLSRIGFAIQYRADSYRARIAQSELQKGGLSSYQAQYKAGVLAAEASIASVINAAGTAKN